MAGELRDRFFSAFQDNKGKVEKIVKDGPESFAERKEAFIEWGRVYVDDLKSKSNTEKLDKAKDNFFVLLRNLGINDELLRQTFVQNKKELLDPIIGETVAILSLVLGWSNKDKEAFSQALGEIGVAGVFAAKPFICLIAICGLAWGYNDHFHSEAFKKGGVLGLAGITAVTLSPGGFVGLLSAIVTMVYFNKKLKVDRPIETQLKEIFKQVLDGQFFKEVRESWKSFEQFLSKLVRKPGQSTNMAVVNVGDTKT